LEHLDRQESGTSPIEEIIELVLRDSHRAAVALPFHGDSRQQVTVGALAYIDGKRLPKLCQSSELGPKSG
jgi:hypothetical protein